MLGNHGRSLATTVFTPIAKVLARLHITPNMVTLGSTALVVLLSILLLAQNYVWQGGIILGILLFCDSVDGVLARLTDSESSFGAFLDSTMDRIGDGAVFGCLLYNAIVHMPASHAQTAAMIAGIAAMVGVGTVPYVRARAETVGVIAKVGIAERTDRLIIALVCAGLTNVGLSVWFYAGGLIWVAFASAVTVGQRILYTQRALSNGD